MKKLLSFLFLFSFLFSQNLDTIVSDREVSLNESIDFTIKLNNIDTNPEVNFDPVIDYFSIISGPNIGSEYKFINGKKSSSRSISWRIIPKRTGRITIPSLEVKVGKEIYLTNEIVITVSEQISNSTNNDMFLKIEVSDVNVKVGEQINIKYTFFTRIASRVIETEFPSYEGFYEEKLYDPSGSKITPDSWSDIVIDNYKYKSVKLYEVALFPMFDGSFNLDPMIMKVETKESDPSFKRLFWDDPFFDTFSQKTKARFLVSDKQTITVSTLNNKPDSFTGAVGMFDISSSLSSSDVENGTPVTFYIKLKGEGNLDNIGRPAIDFPKNIDIFEGEIRKERDISDKVSGSVIWEYNLIPRKYGKYIIPSVKFPFFDTSLNSWKNVKTKPINLNVTKSVQKNYDNNNNNIVTGKEIRYIKLDTPSWNKYNSNRFYIICLLITFTAFVLFLAPLFSVKISSFINEQALRFKKNSALSNSLDTLSFSKDIHGDCISIFSLFFYDKNMISSINVDSTILEDELKDKIEPKHLKKLKSILEHCNQYKYTDISSGQDAVIKEKITKLLTEINKYV